MQLGIAGWFLFFATVLGVYSPNILHQGPSRAQTCSNNYMDAPRLMPMAANATSFDWWYFAAVSSFSNASVVLVFWDNGPEATRNPYLGGPFSVTINGTFANGTSFSLATAAPGGATVTNDENGIVAAWEGSGFSFTGTNLHKPNAEYHAKIDNPELGIRGSIVLRARAPPHYPCSGAGSKQTAQVMPHTFWANAVPSADAFVDLAIGSTSLQITDGIGYYEEAWGDAPLISNVNLWYWGYARFGPYSIVWFDILDRENMTEYASGYVSREGKVLLSSCEPGAVTVRPWGTNSKFPPDVSTGLMQGLYAQFKLLDGQTLSANITTDTVVFYAHGISARMLGTVVGGIDESNESHEGRTLFEELKLIGAHVA